MKSSKKHTLHILANVICYLTMASFLFTVGCLYCTLFIFTDDAQVTALYVFLYSLIPLAVLFILLAIFSDYMFDTSDEDYNTVQKRYSNLEYKTNEELEKEYEQMRRKTEELRKANQKEELSLHDRVAGLFLMDKLFGGGLFGKKK